MNHPKPRMPKAPPMHPDHPMMQCDWCGKFFPAHPEACVETGISSEDGLPDTEEYDSYERKRMCDDMGITDEQLTELLATGSIEGLGAIVCLSCQLDDEGPEYGCEDYGETD